MDAGIYQPVRGAFLPLRLSSQFFRVADQGLQAVVEKRADGLSVEHVIVDTGYSRVIQTETEGVPISFGRSIELIEGGPCS